MGQPGGRLVDPVTGIEFVAAPAGQFRMGDHCDQGLENEYPVHEVRLDGFLIGRFPVTQRQWLSLMPNNNSRFKGDTLPVEQVSWEEVQIYIDKLAKTIPGDVAVDLPTEAQWEYAARSGGREEKYAGGDAAEPVAWFDENSGGATHPVGTKVPNGLGLYDMSGNVWEWCRDIYREDAYRRHQQDNPVLTERGRDRVIRGGGWNVDSWSVRCARRAHLPSDLHGPALGFRLALNPIRGRGRT